MDSVFDMEVRMRLCGFGVGFVILSVLLTIVWGLRRKRKDPGRQNVVVVEPSNYLLKSLCRFHYLLKGPDLLLRAYTKNVPFATPTPEGYQVHFSSLTHIKELVQAPDTVLSLHALAKDMFQPQYTMNGLGVDDTMSANGTVHQRALQAELRSNLPALKQPLSEVIYQALTDEITSQPIISDGWRTVRIFPMAKKLIARANALVFFGDKLSRNPAFLTAALEYPEHLMETAEVLRLIPRWLAPFAAPILMRRHRALKVLLVQLTPVVEARLRLTQNTEQTPPVHRDCIQFFVNAAARKNQAGEWPARRIVQVLLGIWFASVHQPAMCLFYALDDLCLHPEYLDALRGEAAQAITVGASECNEHDGIMNALPLLDAFLKESARMNPTDSISVRRKVLSPFCFGDGTSLAAGDVACIPVQPILQDPEIYNDPLTFNPYRFVSEPEPETGGQKAYKLKSMSSSAFTDADVTFPIWGLGKRACPGRYYASLLLKLVLAHVVLRYDMRIPGGEQGEDKWGKRYFFWRSAIVPRAGAVLELRERDEVG